MTLNTFLLNRKIIFTISVALIIGIIVILTIIERILHKKVKIKREIEKNEYKIKIKEIYHSKENYSQKLSKIDLLAKRFFNENFDLPLETSYSDIAEKMKSENKPLIVKFCQQMLITLYSGDKFDERVLKNILLNLNRIQENYRKPLQERIRQKAISYEPNKITPTTLQKKSESMPSAPEKEKKGFFNYFKKEEKPIKIVKLSELKREKQSPSPKIMPVAQKESQEKIIAGKKIAQIRKEPTEKKGFFSFLKKKEKPIKIVKLSEIQKEKNLAKQKEEIIPTKEIIQKLPSSPSIDVKTPSKTKQKVKKKWFSFFKSKRKKLEEEQILKEAIKNIPKPKHMQESGQIPTEIIPQRFKKEKKIFINLFQKKEQPITKHEAKIKPESELILKPEPEIIPPQIEEIKRPRRIIPREDEYTHIKSMDNLERIKIKIKERRANLNKN